MFLLSRVLLVFAGIWLFEAAMAVEGNEDPVKEKEIVQRVKRRQFPGGVDEADLKVQTPLPTPVRKIAPSADDEKSESALAGSGPAED